MPLDATYEWRQTASLIVLEVPLKGSSANLVDVNATELLLKISFDRYLLHLDLLHPIIDEKCIAKIKNGTLILKIPKKDHKIWDTLQVEGLSKAELKSRRAVAQEVKSLTENELYEKAKERKIEDERKALRKQMALEEDERQHIDDLKTEEKRVAEDTIFRAIAQDNTSEPRMTSVVATIDKVLAHNSSQPKKSTPQITKETVNQKGGEFSEQDNLGDFDDAAIDAMLAQDDDFELVEVPSSTEEAYAQPLYAQEDTDIEEASYTPEPRTGGVVKFNFTPRIFPTPMRESKQYEEEDWIAKNRNHLRQNPQLKPQLDAMDIGDSDPTWLKGKGDDFYRARDYRAALNAYTTALEISPNMINVLANRGACHLQLGELVRCVEDCDALITALDIESMGVDANPSDIGKLAMRVKALARRGAAKCAQGRFEDALKDLHEANYLSPSDSSLENDLLRVANLAKCDKLKKEADAELGRGNFEKALEAYRGVLEIDSKFVSALSNRAACYLAMGRSQECADDCTRALELLSVDPKDTSSHQEASIRVPSFGSEGSGPSAPSGPVPPPGSTKRRTWVLKTVARRGVALSNLGRIQEAASDYRLACKLEPNDENLKRDLETLEKQMEATNSASHMV